VSLRRELDRFKRVIQRREERQGNLLLATIVDASPHATYGYVVARLVDGTAINVRAWTPVALANGQQILVAPMGGQTWNWYALIQANASTDVEATPYTPPSLAPRALTQHSLGGSAHTGNLPWSRIDTSSSKVNLASQVVGVLPLANQAKQTVIDVVTIETGEIAAAQTKTGKIAGPRLALVRKVQIAGNEPCTLRFFEADRGDVEYATASVTPPFLDQGGWVHLADASMFYWEVTNDGVGPDTYTITLQVIGWEV